MPRRRARCGWLALAAATAAVAAARPGLARHHGRGAGAAGAGPLAAADAAGTTPPKRPHAATAHSAAGPTIDVDALVQHNLALYADAVRQRNDRVRALYGGDLDAVVPWNGDAAGETYLWDFFPPAFNCPFRERLGRLSDGGKVVCNWQALAARCAAGPDAAAVYSVGVRGDVSFEADLANRTGCAVHAFDHTVDGLPSPVAGVRFNRVGLAPADAPPALLSLPTMMAARGHDRVHLLKVDCEGCEWAVFGELARSGALARVDQVLIELHFRQPATNLAGPDSGVRQHSHPPCARRAGCARSARRVGGARGARRTRGARRARRIPASPAPQSKLKTHTPPPGDRHSTVPRYAPPPTRLPRRAWACNTSPLCPRPRPLAPAATTGPGTACRARPP